MREEDLILGRKHSKETKEKIRQKALGRKMSKEAIEKMAASKRGKIPWNKGIHMWDNKPHPRGMLGKKNSEESREKHRIANLKRYENPDVGRQQGEKRKKFLEEHPEELLKMSIRMKEYYETHPPHRGFLGKHCTDEHKEKISMWRCAHPHESKSGYREDLKEYFRSTWEANFARILKFENEYYEYEKYSFFLEKGSRYIPDFYLPQEDVFVEIKGYWNERGKNKVLRFKKQYPDKLLIIVGEKTYDYLKNSYQKIILNWED